MKLIIGLGNPGKEYDNNRHNLGFICLDQWAQSREKKFAKGADFDYIVMENVILIKPKTFMNNSGEAVKQVLAKWKVNEFLVVYDDIELPIAKIRIRQGGGDGGHNGIKSLLKVIPPEELKRIRIGVGRNKAIAPRDYVLSDFLPEEKVLLNSVLALAGKFIDIYIKYDFNAVLNEYSIWKKSCSGAESSGIISPKEES
ncbi:MAG: aminoacyl-tRNA hydrolase [Candidatus Cloacimonas sp.]